MLCDENEDCGCNEGCDDCLPAGLDVPEVIPERDDCERLETLVTDLSARALVSNCGIKVVGQTINRVGDAYSVTLTLSGNEGPPELSTNKKSWVPGLTIGGIRSGNATIYIREAYRKQCQTAVFIDLPDCNNPPAAPGVSITNNTCDDLAAGVIGLTALPAGVIARWYTSENGTGLATANPPAYHPSQVVRGSVRFCRTDISDCCSAPVPFATAPATCVCTAVNWGSLDIPTPNVGQVFNLTIPLQGTPPFSIASQSKPGWLSVSININNQLVLAGQPSSSDAGSPQSISITVQNCGGSKQKILSTAWTIPRPENQLPVIAISIPDQEATVGVPFSYQIPANAAIDPDGQIVATSVANLPLGITHNATTRNISGTATTAGPKNVTVTYMDDRQGTAVDTFVFTVKPAVVNIPPVAPTIPDQPAVVGVPFSYTLPNATDADGQIVNIAVSGIPSGLSFNSSLRVISGTPTSVSAPTVTAVYTDNGGASASASFVINVTEVPVVAETDITEIYVRYDGATGSVHKWDFAVVTPVATPIMYLPVGDIPTFGEVYNGPFNSRTSVPGSGDAGAPNDLSRAYDPLEVRFKKQGATDFISVVVDPPIATGTWIRVYSAAEGGGGGGTTPIESSTKPDWVQKFGFSRNNTTRDASAYLKVTRAVTVSVERLTAGTQPAGLGWDAGVYRTPEVDIYHPEFGLVLRFNPTSSGVGGLEAGVPYRFKIKDAQGNIFFKDITFAASTLPITDLLEVVEPAPTPPTELTSVPSWLEKFALSRTALTRETSAWLKTTVPVKVAVRLSTSGTQPSGIGWQSGVYRATDIDTIQTAYGQVVRFNPISSGSGGLVAGVSYDYLILNEATNEAYKHPYTFGNSDMGITELIAVITEPEEPEGPPPTSETGARPAANYATTYFYASPEIMKLVGTFNPATGKMTFTDTATPNVPTGYRKIYFINGKNRAANGDVYTSFPAVGFFPGTYLCVEMFITKSLTGDDLDGGIRADQTFVLAHKSGRAQNIIRVGNS